MSQGRASRRNSDAAASAAAGTDSWDGVHEVDLCQPALAAAITRDAERRCSQQRERTSQAIKTALEEVSKATRAVESETVRNLLRGLQNHEERAWTPHTRKKQHPRCRKAKVGRATGLANTPPWAREFNDRKRRVSWVAATESKIDEEPPPFPAGAPLEPPPLPPPRRGTIVSAVLAAAAMATEHPSSPNLMSSKEKGGGEGGSVNPGVLDDDWVVRKLAQIRRRSRSIDSAIGDIPGMRMRGSPTTLQHLAKSSGEQTTQEAPRETTSSTASAPTGTTVVIDDTTKEGSWVTPLEQQGGVATLQPLPYPSRTDVGRLHISSHNGEQGPPHPSPLLLQPEQMVALPPFAASNEEVLHGPDATRHPPKDDQGQEDQQQQEDRQLLLLNLTPEEEALSLPNSSLLAADGSGDLGELELHERSVRWRGPECAAVGAEGGDGGGRGTGDGREGNAAGGGRETVWSRRRKKKEADEASAKKEAEVANEKRARMVLEVLARSKHIFRCNAARRRRNSSDDALGGRGLNGTSSADDIRKGMRARRGTPKSTTDGRPRTSPFPDGRTTIAASAVSGNASTDTKRSPLRINDNTDNGDNTSGEKNNRESSAEAYNTSKKSSGGQDTAVYARTAKPSSSLPALPANSENGGATADQDPAVNISWGKKDHTTGTAPAETNTGAAAERGDSGVALAAKRVAMKRHREKAEEKKRAQEKTTKLEAKRAFEASLRAFVTRPNLPPATSTANETGRSGVGTRRRASAPEWACISSDRGSGASSGSRYRETAPEESSNRGMCVRVRVPVAARETTQATAISGTLAAPPRRDGKDLYDAQISGSDHVDSIKQEVSKARPPPGNSVESIKPTPPVGSVDAHTDCPGQATEQRQNSIHRRRHRRRQCREAREEEKRTAGLLEELCKRGQDAMTSIDARLRHDSSERRHSNWEREMDDELELGTLGEVSTRDARPRTSNMSKSKHHSAVRTAAVTLGEQSGVGDCGGRADGSSVAKTRQKRRRGSSVHLRHVRRPEGKQIGVGGAERLSIAAVLHDPIGVRRKSQSPPRTYFSLAEELTTEGGKRSSLPQRQHRGLPERKKRRRKRQKYRRHQQHQQHQHRLGRSEPLLSEEGRDGDGHDDSEANATSTPEKDLGRTETPGATWRSGIIAKAEAKVNADNGEHQTTRTPAEETAQQKLPGNTQQKRAALDGESRKATFKPPAETRVDRGPTVGTCQGSLDSRRGRNVSVDLRAAPKTSVYVGQQRANGIDAEAKVMGRAPAASPEGREQGLEAGAGPPGGHDEDREEGFESRSSVTGESRFRRNRRRKSQQRIAGETSLKPGRREHSSGEIRHPQVLQGAAESGEGTAPNADKDDAGGDNVHKIETPVAIEAGDGTILRTGKDDSLLTDDGGVSAGIGGGSGGGGGGGGGGGESDDGGDDYGREDGRSKAWLTVGVEVARKRCETRGEDEGETSSIETLYDILQRVGNEIEGLGVSIGEAGSRNAEDTLHEVVEGAGERWNPGGSQNSVDVDHPEPYNRFSANGAGAEQEGWFQNENSESVAECLQQRGGSKQRQGVGTSEVLSSAEKLCCILEERGQESEEG